MVDVGGEWDTIKTAKIRELKTKDVWRLTRDDEDPTKVVYINQKGDATWAPPMDKLNTVEEFEFRGPYTEYSIKKLSPGWAWWYQPLSEVMPEAESIRLAKSEREHSYGEYSLDSLESVGEQDKAKKTDCSQVMFPEAPSGKDRKTLSLSHIQEVGTSGSRVGVLTENTSDVDVDQISNQAAPSTTDPQLAGLEEGLEGEDGRHIEIRWFIEVCCETDSMLATVAERHGWKAFRITQEKPLEGEEARVLFTMALEHLRHGGQVHAWFSLPCTAWSSWQRINLLRMADPTILDQKRKYSLELQELFYHYGQLLMAEGGDVSFEWPAYCDGWNCDRIQEFMDNPGVTSAVCHGCMLNFVSKVEQRPMKKPFQIVSTDSSLIDHMATFKCDRSHEHAPTQGSDTVRTGNYTERFCEEVISAFRGNGTSGSRVGVSKSLRIMETKAPSKGLFSGKEKNGYTVDSGETTAWMDILEIDYQRKLRLCEHHSDNYRRLLLDCPHLMEPVGDIKSLYSLQGSVSINVTNALQDQEVPDFFATPVMKPLTLNAHTIFDDPTHRPGWIEAVQAELDSFDALEVMDSVPDKGQKAIPSQLVATVKPSNAVTTLLESEGITSK
eukprot:1157957-Amphidinium_carterae.1